MSLVFFICLVKSFNVKNVIRSRGQVIITAGGFLVLRSPPDYSTVATGVD